MKHIITITDKDITGSDNLSSAEPRIAVNAVLFDCDGNIALSYMGKYDLHTLPGGGVDPGENYHAAVKREVWEETGCECEIIGELGKIMENRYENDFTQERYYYFAKVVGEKGDLHLTDEEIAESTTVEWHSMEQAIKIISEKQQDNYQRNFIQKRDIAALTEALMWSQTHDVPGYDNFIKIEPVNKGWSNDTKYYIEAADGRRLLLRVADVSEYERKRKEIDVMKRISALGIKMSQPLDFGTCNDGKSVYQLLTWCDGEEAKDLLPTLSETEQYVLGLKAGDYLRKIHTLENYPPSSEWSKSYSKKIDGYIEKYKSCGMTFEGDKLLLDYIDKHRFLMENRPMCLTHGDFHAGNLVISPNKKLFVIDFQRYRVVDPYCALMSIMFSADVSPHFATGQLRGYFNGEPPEDFWDLLVFYMAVVQVNAIPWSIPFGQKEIDFAYKSIENIFHWFNNMNNPVPTWYLKEFYIQWIDGIPYKLKAPFDFSFIAKYGKVFKAFDEQGSGNIAFGVQNGDKKYFIKFAGAPKEKYIANRDSGAVAAASAIESLKKAVPIYSELAHPTLIKFLEAEEIGGGYAAVFEWEDAVGIEPKGSPDYMKFMQMPVEKKIRAFEDIMEYHTHVAAKGYVALDFYDGSILYDYEKEKVIICDIDLYQKSPFQNVGNLGIVGSARYVSPEECVPDAIMDEVTNVYTMGATAFALFAYGERSLEAWTLNTAMYDVVKKAVSDERNERQQSIVQLIKDWSLAK